MKRFGFTLAEVLITLSIIGISAALTIPAVVTNVQTKTYISRLSTTVEDLDNAFTSALAMERQPSVFSLSFWPNGDKNDGLKNGAGNSVKQRFNGEMSKYLNYRTVNKSPNEIYSGKNCYKLAKDGGRGSVWNDNYKTTYLSGGYPIIMKSGAVVFLTLIPRAGRLKIGEKDDNDKQNYITEEEAVKRGTSLQCVTGYATIDVNGADTPNTVGRDIFVFLIGQNGHLYPYGGMEYTKFEQEGSDAYHWSKDNKDGYACLDNLKNVDGMGCTGRVVEEGYKITY